MISSSFPGLGNWVRSLGPELMKISPGKIHYHHFPSVGRIGMLDHQGTAAGLWARSTRQRRQSRSPFDERPAKEAWDFEGGWVLLCVFILLLLLSSSSFFLGLSSSCCFQSFICFTTENPQENLFSPWIHAGLGGSAVFFPPPVGGRTLFYRHDKAEGWVSKVGKVNAPKTTWSKSSAAVPVPVSDSFPTHVSHQWHGASITQPAAWHMFNLSLCSSWWRVQGAIRIHQRQFPNSILMGRANTTRYDMTNPSWDKKHKGDPCPCREHLPVSQMEHYHTARAQGRHISVAQKWLQ